MCLKWKCADLQTCTTNILIKVEKLIKYYTAVAEKYELIHLHRDLSLSMIKVLHYLYTYTDRQTTQILFSCGDLNTISSDFSHDAQLYSCYLCIMCPSSWGTHVATYIHVPPRPSTHSTHNTTIGELE